MMDTIKTPASLYDAVCVCHASCRRFVLDVHPLGLEPWIGPASRGQNVSGAVADWITTHLAQGFAGALWLRRDPELVRSFEWFPRKRDSHPERTAAIVTAVRARAQTMTLPEGVRIRVEDVAHRIQPYPRVAGLFTGIIAHVEGGFLASTGSHAFHARVVAVPAEPKGKR